LEVGDREVRAAWARKVDRVEWCCEPGVIAGRVWDAASRACLMMLAGRGGGSDCVLVLESRVKGLRVEKGESIRPRMGPLEGRIGIGEKTWRRYDVIWICIYILLLLKR
jgi:hypothetical protein